MLAEVQVELNSEDVWDLIRRGRSHSRWRKQHAQKDGVRSEDADLKEEEVTN